MKKMLVIMLAVVILLASAFYFFYIKGNDTPIIDETIDYEEQLGGKLAKEKTDLNTGEDLFLIEKEIDKERISEETDELINQEEETVNQEKEMKDNKVNDDKDTKKKINLENELTENKEDETKNKSSNAESKNDDNVQEKTEEINIEEMIEKDDEPGPDEELETKSIGSSEESKREESFIIETAPIKYKTIEKEDRSLLKNEAIIKSEGENGEEEITYKIIKVDGVIVEKIRINSKVTKKVIDEIITVGTTSENNSKELPNYYSFSYKDDLEKELINLINDYRGELGIHELTSKSDLQETARYKSNSMLQLNYFGHTNPNFEVRTFSHFMKREFEVPYRAIGENLGYSSPANSETINNIFESFKASPGHNENMISAKFNYIGIGVINAPETGNKFLQEFSYYNSTFCW